VYDLGCPEVKRTSPEPIETTVNELPGAGFSGATLQAIERGNAERLFPRFKA
jgi:hypothetical protein